MLRGVIFLSHKGNVVEALNENYNREFHLFLTNTFEVVVLIRRRGRRVAEIRHSHAGGIGRLAGALPSPGPGRYDITVHAVDPRNGNTGVDRTTIVVGEAAGQTEAD